MDVIEDNTKTNPSEQYDQEKLADLNGALAFAFYKQDKFAESVQAASTALDILMIINSSKALMATRHLGIFLNANKQFAESALLFRKVISDRPIEDEEIFLGKDLYNLGFALENLERYEDAIECLEKSRPIAQSNGALSLVRLCDASLANCFLKTNAIEKAIATATLAVEGATLADDYEELLKVIKTRAMSYVVDKKYEQALFDLKGAKELYIKKHCHPNWMLVLEVESQIAEIYELQGDLSLANDTRSRIELIKETSL